MTSRGVRPATHAATTVRSTDVIRPTRIEPGPGQESVWDYPRPPAVRTTSAHVRIVHAGLTIVDTTTAVQVLETSQAPAYYVPRNDIAMQHLAPSRDSSWCEWKGRASYWSVAPHGDLSHPNAAVNAAWSYDTPVTAYHAIAGHLAFYAQHLDECWVDDYRVAPNGGDFYGGWITPTVTGPFKGAPGTRFW
jgi:uncharacterized protein (DUF427 family)